MAIHPFPWRNNFKKKEIAATENFSDNAVGSRSKGLDLDLRLREFEISQLTQRNNFFMVFQGVLIAGLVQSQGTAAPVITFSMAMLGVASSLLQIGMAGGAKYWQSRWEASTRSSEIAIIFELVKKRKLAVHTFTHDLSLLTEDERGQIERWNADNPDEQILDNAEHIKKVVLADIQAGSKGNFRKAADWWVKKWAIGPKWSVSRIPIWMGAALLFFWAAIAVNCIHIEGVDFYKYIPDWLSLVPLKS